ncbi:hypothetical protein [Glaesserella parasuis]|uniref:hypothetical protein n=1 Tax=Glaesserella parasuis TaxID=738 RepID=UPI003F3EC9D3
MSIHATNYEVVVTPTLAKGSVTLGTFLTASEATAAARRLRNDWPEGAFNLQIKEVAGD